METTSLKKSPFLSNYIVKIRGLWIYAVLYIVVEFVSTLGLNYNCAKMIGRSADEFETKALYTSNYGQYEFMANLSMALSVAAMVLVAILSYLIYSHMVNKKEADMVFSLPMNNTQRFLSNFLAGLTIWGVPSLLATGIGCMMTDISSLHMITIAALIVKIWIYCVVTMCLSCTGNHIAALIALFTYSAGTILAGGLTITMIRQAVYGLYIGEDLVKLCCPIYVLISVWDVWDLYPVLENDVDVAAIQRLILPILCISLVMFAISWVAQAKRGGESVSKAFPIRWFYRLTQAIVVMALLFPLIETSGILDEEVYIVFLIVAILLALIAIDLGGTPNKYHIGKRILGCAAMGTIAGVYTVAISPCVNAYWNKQTAEELGIDRIVATSDGLIYDIQDPAAIEKIKKETAETAKKNILNSRYYADVYYLKNQHYLAECSVQFREEDEMKALYTPFDTKEVMLQNMEYALKDVHANVYTWGVGRDYALASVPADELRKAFAADVEKANLNESNTYHYYAMFEYRMEISDKDNRVDFTMGGTLKIPYSFTNTVRVLKENGLAPASISELISIYGLPVAITKENVKKTVKNEWDEELNEYDFAYLGLENFDLNDRITLTQEQAEKLVPYLCDYYGNNLGEYNIIAFGNTLFNLKSEGEPLLEGILSSNK